MFDLKTFLSLKEEKYNGNGQNFKYYQWVKKRYQDFSSGFSVDA